MTLLIFGLGFSAQAFAREMAPAFPRIVATTRSEAKAGELAAMGIEPRLLNGDMADLRLAEDIAQASAILVSIPPGEAGDPIIVRFANEITQAPSLRWIGYLSTIGVYGDAQGGWVDETTPVAPPNRRTQIRVEIEEGWADLGRRAGIPTHIFRLGGIYGPGRSVLDDLREGTARRIIKPGQVFNRIHCDDIAGVLAASLAKPDQHGMVYNVVDDEPAPPQDVVAYGARLLGVPPPPEIPFEEADLSPMGRSFYSSNKRVSNRRVRERLAYAFRYPTYREGLESLASPR